MIYCFDIDGTLCTNTDGDYENALPIPARIARVNAEYESGHQVILYTARGSTTGIDWRASTEKQLALWGLKYHLLYFGKPTADIYIDDKAVKVTDWFHQPSAMDDSTGMTNLDYLELTYSEKRLPPSDYPSLLTHWLVDNIYLEPGRFLDVGCGKGEYLKAFASLGFQVTGVDSAKSARLMAEGLPVEVMDIERESLPFADASFDYVFSKSVIEHLFHPDKMLTECFRVLRPGGVAVIMTPSWRHQWRVFHEDYTHVSPFTVNGLSDAMTLVGFSPVQVRLFWQLPFLWRYSWLYPLVQLIALLPVRYRPWDPAPWTESVNKLIRFSKEAMLLGVGKRKEVTS